MSCSKTKFMQLTLFIVLALFSCKKENLNDFQENTTSTPTDLPSQNPQIQTTKILTEIVNQNTTPEHQLIIEVESVLRNLTFGSLLQTAFYPQVYGLNNSIATTRTGCPSSSLSSDNSSSPAVHDITLDYGAGCTSVGNAVYEGTVNIIIQGDLNTIGTTVSIQLNNNFILNSNNDLDGFITLEFDNINGTDIYKIIDINIQNTNLQTAETSTISLPQVQNSDPNLMDGFFIKPNTIGDPGNPLDIINDTLAYSGCFKVDILNGATLRSCASSDINYDLSCGVPFDGMVNVDTLNADGSFGDPSNPNFGTFGDLNFSYPNSIDNGVCDDLVEFSDNIEGTVEIINF